MSRRPKAPEGGDWAKQVPMNKTGGKQGMHFKSKRERKRQGIDVDGMPLLPTPDRVDELDGRLADFLSRERFVARESDGRRDQKFVVRGVPSLVMLMLRRAIYLVPTQCGNRCTVHSAPDVLPGRSAQLVKIMSQIPLLKRADHEAVDNDALFLAPTPKNSVTVRLRVLKREVDSKAGRRFFPGSFKTHKTPSNSVIGLTVDESYTKLAKKREAQRRADICRKQMDRVFGPAFANAVGASQSAEFIDATKSVDPSLLCTSNSLLAVQGDTAAVEPSSHRYWVTSDDARLACAECGKEPAYAACVDCAAEYCRKCDRRIHRDAPGADEKKHVRSASKSPLFPGVRICPLVEPSSLVDVTCVYTRTTGHENALALPGRVSYHQLYDPVLAADAPLAQKLVMSIACPKNVFVRKHVAIAYEGSEATVAPTVVKFSERCNACQKCTYLDWMHAEEPRIPPEWRCASKSKFKPVQIKQPKNCWVLRISLFTDLYTPWEILMELFHILLAAYPQAALDA